MKTKQRALLLASPLVLGSALLLAAAVRPARAVTPRAAELEITDIHWEYNSSANDLGVHVNLDGEDWASLSISDPKGKKLFQVKGKGPYATLGLTELFFEGAEPTLTEFPLSELLSLFPEGEYDFEGTTVDGEDIEGEAQFTHAIPAGTVVSVEQGAGNLLRIHWTEVTSNPPEFPVEPIHIVGYHVIVEPSYEVTLPATARSVTVSPEFVESLEPGTHAFEVLAIDESRNQTITEGTITK